MKKLSKRLRAQSGLTLIETLAAAVILTLLCLALNSGMDIATHTYRSVTAESETQLLLSTAADALTQELRYAAPSKDQTAGTLGTYTSASYGSGAKIDINDGHLVIVTAAAFSCSLPASTARTTSTTFPSAMTASDMTRRRNCSPSPCGRSRLIWPMRSRNSPSAA